MFDNRSTKIYLFGLVAGLLIRYAGAEPRIPMSSAHIAAELASAGVRVRTDQIEMLSNVSSVRANADLTVLSVSDWRGDARKVSLRCTNNADCLPFYIILHHASASEIPQKFSKHDRAATPAGKSRTRTGEILIRGGQSATLVLETENMRITLPVTCLQNGRRGERIRVMSSGARKIYQAEVLEPGLLRGIL
jgi:Chaperone for flagella basal body P-ring formation